MTFAGRGSYLLQRLVSVWRLDGVLHCVECAPLQVTVQQQQHQYHKGESSALTALCSAFMLELSLSCGYEQVWRSSCFLFLTAGAQTTQSPLLSPPALLLLGLLQTFCFLQPVFSHCYCPEPDGLQIPSHPQTQVRWVGALLCSVHQLFFSSSFHFITNIGLLDPITCDGIESGCVFELKCCYRTLLLKKPYVLLM